MITLIPLVVAIVLLVSTDRFYVWPWAIGALMLVVNLFLSWGEILDAIMGRKK